MPVKEAEFKRNNQISMPANRIRKLRQLLCYLEVDRSVVYGILTNIWNIISVPVTLILIATHFTPELQGFYYTFYSIVGLQIFVELGFGVVIVQFAAHEWSKLKLSENNEIVGDQEALSNLRSLAKIVFRWFSIGGLIFGITISVGGWIFFSRSSNHNVNWSNSWFLFCLLSAINVCLLPVWSLLQGCNQVPRVYAYRMLLAVLRSIVIWLAIIAGAGLWTPVISSAAVIIWSIVYLQRYCLPFLRVFFSPLGHGLNLNWRAKFWSMQWRIGVSAISSYFMSWFFTPLLFYYHGAVVAGKMGISLSIMLNLVEFSSIWFQTQVPSFGMLLAKKQYVDLDKLFFRVIRVSISLLLLGSLVIWIGTYLLNIFHHRFADRILSPLPMSLFLLANALIHSTSPFSIYVRAHKEEPFLVLSILSGVLTALLVWFLGSRFAATGVAVGYLAVTALCIFPWIILVWFRYRLTHKDNINISLPEVLKI